MYLNVYDFAQKNRSEKEAELFEKVNECCPEVFLPLLDKYPGEAKDIFYYITDGYSAESTSVLLQSNWSTVKPQLAKKHSIPDHLNGAVVNLECSVIKKVIADYLEFQGDFDFKHLRMLEDVYEQMLNSLYVADFSIEIFNKSRKDMAELRQEIVDLKINLRESYRVFYDNIQQVKVEEKRKAPSLNDLSTSQYVKK